MTKREGFYDSIEIADEYVKRVKTDHMKYQNEELIEVKMNYHFGAMEKAELTKFIGKLNDDGFDRCDSFYIDPDEYADGDQPKFHWIPGKKLKFSGNLLFSELRKYLALAKKNGIIYGGITADDRQGIDD